MFYHKIGFFSLLLFGEVYGREGMGGEEKKE